jgi:hypothetical protein
VLKVEFSARPSASKAGSRTLTLLAVVAALLVVTGCDTAAKTDAAPTALRVPHAMPAAVTLEWVGDIALSTENGLPPGGLSNALRAVRGELRHSDLTLGNLEGTLSTGGGSKCGAAGGANCFAFQAPPAYAMQLRALGFGVLNQANNHALDYGVSGREQTTRALDRAGIGYDGLPGQITIRKVAGQRLAVLGFAPYRYAASLLDIPAAQALVRRARRMAKIVVVIIHAGAEGASEVHTPVGTQYFLGEDRGDARAFAHAVIDAGASVVLGSGPHVVRGVERYRGRLIAYSLGNFVGYRTLVGGGVLSESGIMRVTLDSSGGVLGGRWISIHLDDGLPRRDASNSSAHLVAALSRQDFGADRFPMGPSGLLHTGAEG